MRSYQIDAMMHGEEFSLLNIMSTTRFCSVCSFQVEIFPPLRSDATAASLRFSSTVWLLKLPLLVKYSSDVEQVPNEVNIKIQ